MPHLVKKQAAGNKTIVDFCRRHQIKPSKFFYWKRKMKESGQIKAGDFPGAFLPISFPAIQATEHPEKIELQFPSGLRVGIPVSAGSTAIKTIIKACGN